MSDHPTQNVGLGIALILATALTISVQDLVFKLFSGSLTLAQIFALRGVIAFAMLTAIVALRGPSVGVLHEAVRLWPLLRALCITMAFLTFYAAIPFLSLSTIGAAFYIAPIFVALISAGVIGERVGGLGWLGVLVGFAGVIVLLQPGSDAFSGFAVLPVVGAILYAVGNVITRTRCQGVPVEVLSLSQNGMMMTAGLAISIILVVLAPRGALVDAYPYLFGLWSTVGLIDVLILTLLAVFAVSLGMMLSSAYKLAPPAIVATFEYSYLVFVAMWDILFFGLTPTVASLTGMAMIIAAGLLVMRGRG
ncbi:MAG: DMT family transporter [Pseudomonadota bacterium]